MIKLYGINNQVLFMINANWRDEFFSFTTKNNRKITGSENNEITGSE